MIVVFQKDNGDYAGYGYGKADVTAGTNQSVTITVPIQANTPVANDNYQFQVMISPDGGDYNNRLNNKTQVDVDVTSSFTLTNNAIYRVKSTAANVYLNSTGNTDYANVGVATLNTAWDSEKWTLENVSGNVYRLKSSYGNKYLNSQSGTNGANVNVAALNTGWDSEKWTLEQVSGSTYRLKNSWGLKYLNAEGTANGSNVGVGDLNTGREAQKWTLELVSSSNAAAKISDAVTERSHDVLDVYPNPLSAGDLSIAVKNLTSNKPVLMTVSSILGNTVFSQEVSNNIHYSINRGIFPAKGMYLIKLQDGDFVKTVKVIVD